MREATQPWAWASGTPTTATATPRVSADRTVASLDDAVMCTLSF